MGGEAKGSPSAREWEAGKRGLVGADAGCLMQAGPSLLRPYLRTLSQVPASHTAGRGFSDEKAAEVLPHPWDRQPA